MRPQRGRNSKYTIYENSKDQSDRTIYIRYSDYYSFRQRISDSQCGYHPCANVLEIGRTHLYRRTKGPRPSGIRSIPSSKHCNGNRKGVRQWFFRTSIGTSKAVLPYLSNCVRSADAIELVSISPSDSNR